jgi:MoaA/NifB/PqqE/SkfB family radical SAM enzyme
MEDRDSGMCIGGGEPTLHRNFETMLMLAIEASIQSYNEGGVHVVTNGSVKKRALLLAELARRGVVTAALSQDKYHDSSMVHERVVKAFTSRLESSYDHERRYPDDYRRINENRDSWQLLNEGRCDFGGCGGPDDPDLCCCEGPFIKPSGDVYVCGCTGSTLLGNVVKDGGLAGLWPDRDCYKQKEPNNDD